MLKVELRVKDLIDRRWSDWLGGLTIEYTDQGETLLVGAVTDQAALYGLVAKARDLGLSLASVSVVAGRDQESRTS